MIPRTLAALVVVFLPTLATAAELDVLFLGDNGHHRPRERFVQIVDVLADNGIKLTYTDRVSDLNSDNLSNYDTVVLYANIDRIEPAEEQALLKYVADGGGFVPLHCATYCFRNSEEVVALMGAQFKRHGGEVFRTEIVATDHPIMKDFGGFESWDETYVHHLHNEHNRQVLAYRVDDEGREPWTWVRTHGNGRVFYTAWGHDHRTWGNPGFQNLVERGIRWSAGQSLDNVGAYLADRPFPIPRLTEARTDVAPFEYIDVGAKIPNYRPGARWGTQDANFNLMQKPLPPEESIKHMRVPEGFHLELFASEPDLGGKPVCMAWDERGRLWVAETYDYPNELQPIGEGRDRIRICDDTDNDGRADKFTVFASKLSIPTSIAFHRGGVIVQDASRTLYMKDTDGDDRADVVEVMFSGWGVGDTHGGVSNFQYGLDNWIWAMQGYNHSEPAGAGQQQQAFRQGFFRFRPDGSEVEFIRSTNNNTWGLGISEEGLVFGSTANRNPSVYMPIPNRFYEAVRGWTPSLQLGSIAEDHLFDPVTEKVRQMDHHGGYTAGAGHALYTARNYPPEYWNRTAFVAGPTGHLVGTFVIKSDGADFRSSNEFNLVASDDEWTAPIMAEIGPDGNVWILDWYNFIIQHNPTPKGFKTGKGNAYETDLRDKKHGRVYRLIYGNDERGPALSLAGASHDKLVETLAHPTSLWRKHAQRLLVECGDPSVVPALVALIENQDVDAIGLNVGAIHALWTLKGLGVLDGLQAVPLEVAVHALNHPSAGVRRNAIQVLPEIDAVIPALIADKRGIHDPDAQVRLAAFLKLSEISTADDADVGQAITQAIGQAPNSDRWLSEAATCAAARHSEGFLIAAAQQPSNPKLLAAVRIVANHYARGKDPRRLAAILRTLRRADGPTINAIAEGLTKWPADSRPQLTDELTSELRTLVKNLPSDSRGRVAQLANSWGSDEFRDYLADLATSLLAVVADEAKSDRERLAAITELTDMQMIDAGVGESLLDAISAQTPPDVAAQIIRSLQGSEASEIGPAIVGRFASLTPTLREEGIQLLLRRPALTKSLLAGIDAGTIQLSELTLDQKQSLRSHPDKAIRQLALAVFERGGAIPSPDRQKVLESLLDVAHESGSGTNGKEVYKKHCAKCHIHGEEGVRIGPDLTGMAVHPKEELLMQIIDPNRNVEGNFRVYTVETSDGVLLNGLLASESKTAIELIDAEGKKQTLLRTDIDDLVASRKSLMPEGFEQQMNKEELRDLLEFLTQRGRFLPLDLSKAATITSARGMFFRPEGTFERLIFSDWGPKTFKGVPFLLIDPRDGKVANTILLYSRNGEIPPRMPKLVELPCNAPAKIIHFLSGVAGWGHPLGSKGTVSLIVRLHYANGETEDHQLKNGEHFADYVRRIDVPASEFAFSLNGKQLRYLNISPQQPNETIEKISLIKGDDALSPIVMAMTVEGAG